MHSAPRLLPFLLAAAAAAAGVAVAQRTPDDALHALRAGNTRFAADRSAVPPLGEGVRRTLATGQSPIAIVLCCADSRVPPEHVFNCGLGELFVVRVAGHAADAEVIASIEYAVEHLGVPYGIVLGHDACGAVAAAAARVGATTPSAATSAALQQLLERIEPAARRAAARGLGGRDHATACEEEHAHATVHDCLRRSELLRRYTTTGRFRLDAARYDLRSGVVEWLPPRPLPAEPAVQQQALLGTVPTGVPPHVALRLLQGGHRRFLGDGRPAADLGATRRESLLHGQQPLAIVLACADSRVAPEHVFDAGLGELFVVRIAGNTLTDDALASIEHAATALGASLLVVMGHTRCGAMQAAARSPEASELTPNLRLLLARLEPSVAAARSTANGHDVADVAVRHHARRVVTELGARSVVLRTLQAQGRFEALACVYDVASGDLEWLDGARASDAPAPAGPVAAPRPVPAAQATPATPAGESAPTTLALGRHEPAAGVRATSARPTRTAGSAAPEPEAAATAPAPLSLHDPIVLVGMAGALSLLAAAVLAIRRR